MVAWLSHAGTLIRAAPEHLRMATSLETRTYDILQEASLLNQKDLTGSKYVDLGAVPTAAEERTATHMQVDEPPPMDVSESSPQPPGTASGSQRPDPRTRAREEPDGEQPPDRSTPEESSDSSSDSSSSSSSDEEPEPQRTPPERQNAPQPNVTTSTTTAQRGPGLPSGPQRQLPRPSRPPTTNESRARERSRSPRAVPNRTLHVENLKASQGENANDVYFAQLTKKGKKKDQEYDPAFTFVDGSKKANRIKGDQWNDTMFEMSVDVYEEDINFINSPMPTSQDLQEHLAFMLADHKRKLKSAFET